MNGNSRDILGAVLAGGRSSRMGRDKAGLLMGQDTFLAALCALCAPKPSFP